MKLFTRTVTAVSLILSLGATSLMAQTVTPEQRGQDIFVEVKKRDTGWGDSKANMQMILSNGNGQQSIRQIKIKTLELQGDGDKSLTIFDKPRDVKGTAFLSYSHSVGADDQWLYMPAIKRVKRISSRNKSGPFMGSEFAFEDFSSFELQKYRYNFLAQEQLNGKDCFKVEQFPLDENSGYTRRVVWVDKQHYLEQKVEFYDRKDVLLKTLIFSGYQQYTGNFWRAQSMNMTNHQNGKSTELKWFDYAFNTGLSEKDFSRNALKRR